MPGSRDEVRERMDAYLAAGDVLTGTPTGARGEISAADLTAEGDETA
jgi:hypothetical protein